MTKAMRIWERTLLGVAIVWGLALPVLALLVPAYRGETVEISSDGASTTTPTSATLVQVDGWYSLFVISVPLVVAVITTALLAHRRPERGPGAIVTTLVGLLAVGTFLAMLTVGIFVLPVTLCLAVAWAIRLAAAVPAPPPAPTPGPLAG